MMIMRFFFSDFLYKGICCGYSFELHRQVNAIQIRTHSICLYKKVNKKYTGCNLKTTKFHECALIGVCAVIRSNTVINNEYQSDYKVKEIFTKNFEPKDICTLQHSHSSAPQNAKF